MNCTRLPIANNQHPAAARSALQRQATATFPVLDLAASLCGAFSAFLSEIRRMQFGPSATQFLIRTSSPVTKVRFHKPVVAIASLCLTLSGCASSADSGAAPEPLPSVSLTVPQDSLSLIRSQEVRFTATLQTNRPFSTPYTIKVLQTNQDAPTVSVGQPTVSAGQSFEIAIKVAPFGTPGTYRATIVATLRDSIRAERIVTIHVPAPTARVDVSGVGDTIWPTAPLSRRISLTRLNGFSDSVRLSLPLNLPTGMTATLSRTLLQPGSDTATLVLSANYGAQEGAGSLVLTTFSPSLGLQDRTVSYNVRLPRSILFDATLDSNEVAVPYGRSGGLTVRLTRLNGFTGYVGLSAEGLPAGVLSTAPGFSDLRAPTSTLSFAQLPNTPPGRYPATAVLTADAAISVRLPFWIVVLPP